MAVRIGRLALHAGVKKATEKSNDLRTGCSVSASGIYRVIHPQHRLPSEVTLLTNQPFPRCSKCAEPVDFELVRSAPDIAEFKVMLYELPEVAEPDDSLAG